MAAQLPRFAKIFLLLFCILNYAQARRFKNAATTWCLDSDHNGAVYTKECYSSGGGYQDWSWNGGAVRNSETGKCLEADYNHAVYATNCHGGSHQQWRGTDNLAMINIATGYCLDSNKAVYTKDCNNGIYQIWLS